VLGELKGKARGKNRVIRVMKKQLVASWLRPRYHSGEENGGKGGGCIKSLTVIGAGDGGGTRGGGDTKVKLKHAEESIATKNGVVRGHSVFSQRGGDQVDKGQWGGKGGCRGK